MRISMIPLFIILIICLSSCGYKTFPIKATIESKGIPTVYTDKITMKIIETAVNSVKRESGAIDVGPSDYRIILDYNDDTTMRYYLYLNFDNQSGYLIRGSIDSMFRLKDKDAEKLIGLIEK